MELLTLFAHFEKKKGKVACLYGFIDTKQHVIDKKCLRIFKIAFSGGKGGNFKRSAKTSGAIISKYKHKQRHLALKVQSIANNNGGLVVQDVFCQFCLYNTFLNDFNGSAGKTKHFCIYL